MRTCVKRGKKASWVNSFAANICCSYQTNEYELEEKIASEMAEDGCTNVTLSCTWKNEKPTVTFFTENTCQKPVSEEVFNASSMGIADSFKSIMTTLAVIVNNTSKYNFL